MVSSRSEAEEVQEQTRPQAQAQANINPTHPDFKNAPCPIGPWWRRLGGDEAKAKHLARKKPNCADLVRETDVRRKTTPHGQFASGGGDSHSASGSHVVQLEGRHGTSTLQRDMYSRTYTHIQGSFFYNKKKKKKLDISIPPVPNYLSISRD